MNKQKLEAYRVQGSIHTLSVKSPNRVDGVQETVRECITTSTSTTKDGGEVTKAILNPNKLNGDVFSFSEFQTVVDTILAGAGIRDYQINRADMRFDSYEPDHYERYAKLNRYLISALAVVYKVKNTYRTTNLFSDKQLSVAAKTDYWEIENYDRSAKSEITGNTAEPAKSRLEVRTVSRQWSKINEKPGDNMDKLKTDMIDRWFSRWDKAIQNLPLVWQRYNDELEKIYNADKEAYPKKFRSLTDFLIRYQGCIFCKAQLVDLLKRFPEVKNPEWRAINHKRRYGCEFFSEADVKAAVNEVKRATLEFFNK